MQKLSLFVFVVFHWLMWLLASLQTLVYRISFFKKWSYLFRGLGGGKRSVLYLACFFPGNAGYEYRVSAWAERLRSQGYKVKALHVFGQQALNDAHNGKGISWFLLKNLWKRYWQVCRSVFYGVVIVRRELLYFNDYGGHFMEALLRSMHPNIVLDFDDDIAAAKGEPRQIESAFGKLMLETPTKFTGSLKYYNYLICGSNYLKQLALEMAPAFSAEQILVIPTCVDYEQYTPRSYTENSAKPTIVFGWLGGVYNLPLIDIVAPVLHQLSKEQRIRLDVISGAPYQTNYDFEVRNIQWGMQSQIEDIKQIDIGLMPLTIDKRSAGKCGFKLIQYMGLGVVSIGTALTVNTEIIEEGINGYLVEENKDWLATLRRAIAERSDWPKMSEAARHSIITRYTFDSQREKMIAFMDSIIE